MSARGYVGAFFGPGPYVCGEWDFGGLPPYLLKYPDIKIRGMDKRFMEATSRYIKKYFFRNYFYAMH